MSTTSGPHKPPKIALAYANFVVRRPWVVLTVLLVSGVAASFGVKRLTINSNQLDLISQDMPEVKDVKRVIDMVGGAGYLMLGMRSTDEATLKGVSDDLAQRFNADKEHVRFITYKIPVEFIQKNMVLFVKTEDLMEGRNRINAYLRDQLRRSNPFYIEIRKTEPVKLDLSDLIAHYSHIGKKSILDDYYISDDHKMLLMLIKPNWDSNELGKTHDYIDKLRADLEAYSKDNPRGVKLVEDYQRMGEGKTIAYGFTGSYKLALDDSFAIAESLGPITWIALISIALITVVFFRRAVPSIIVVSGMMLGTLLTMGFTYLVFGQLNMVTSMLGGILMGFGVDYGIHFTFRTRLELGAGKPYDVAIRDALINAGRPALISAVVTAGSFFVLLVSQFKGFSQFGLLAGCGTFLIGFTMFSWSPSILAILGNRWPDLPAKLIGTMKPPSTHRSGGGEIQVPRPKLVLGIAGAVVAILCAFAIPWSSAELPENRPPTLWERLKSGIRFNYNTRALMPANRPSVLLLDEISDRFKISADPVAVYTPTLEGAKDVFDGLNPLDPKKYSTIEQVVSIYSFVPPPETALANAKVLAEWKEDLKDIDIKSLPPELQQKAEMFQAMLDAKPFDVKSVPAVYADQFKALPTARPENQGYLTFIYPGVDLWQGKKMLEFTDQVRHIVGKSGKVYRAAGASILYAKLARIVLADGRLTLLLTAIWILLMHYADFRSVKLALASVIPLGVGLVMTLGIMSITNEQLNFMNIIILPILLGFGVSHGLYLLHRFLEGVSPVVALRSVGAAVASSTLTAIAGFASLFAASHNGLRSMGLVACLGLFNTLIVSFTVLAAVMQLIHEQRVRTAAPEAAPKLPQTSAAAPAED